MTSADNLISTRYALDLGNNKHACTRKYIV